MVSHSIPVRSAEIIIFILLKRNRQGVWATSKFISTWQLGATKVLRRNQKKLSTYDGTLSLKVLDKMDFSLVSDTADNKALISWFAEMSCSQKTFPKGGYANSSLLTQTSTSALMWDRSLFSAPWLGDHWPKSPLSHLAMTATLC